jgi:hypothetical protein
MNQSVVLYGYGTLARSQRNPSHTGKGFAILGNGKLERHPGTRTTPVFGVAIAQAVGMQCCHYDDDDAVMINVHAPARVHLGC